MTFTIDPDFQSKALSVIMSFIMEFSGITAEPEPVELTAGNLNVSTISVSCLKVTWDSEADRDYTVSCTAHDENYAFTDNMYFNFKGNDLCYITGLREGTEYTVSVEPVLSEEEKDDYRVKTASADGKTETVEVIYEFPHEDGWTNCFAGEKASGLTAMPSSGAIYGSTVDTITDTGIRRDEYGDYCCAMGVWYGYCQDRFLIELENGTQFTTKICDSKGFADDGEGRYHIFGNGGKCIVEFIYDDYNWPSCVAFSGSWGYYNWNGLDLSANIKSIKKINYGEPVEY
ncbi:fibronectin type III domain-containing protein [Ruminococcus albus]|uniref:fibronectin type III domain-containing protein n=1 Tax=Ruminococcus albus TaxID=1264 RepID=UPI0004AE77A3|nr:fibronectin type III domain-containing protein [Ruminococcus albus]